MKRYLIVVGALLLVMSGCERVFTTSPLQALQRDPAAYTDAQRLTYAEDALASGNPAEMAEAFELIRGSIDPETQLLAVELALGAAGVESALTDLVGGLASGDSEPEDVLTEALESLSEEDLALLVEAAEILALAEEGADPTAEQYAFVAVGLVAAAAEDAGGVDNLNPPPADTDAETYVDQATEFFADANALLEESGETSEILEGFTGLLP